MNTYNISDEKLNNLIEYQKFISENQGEGSLRIRAYGANEAVPIGGLNIEVSTMIDDNIKVIFFKGITDSSGMIKKLSLPAPVNSSDNLIAPKWTSYNIQATYEGTVENFEVRLYDGILVQQIINITPNTLIRGYNYGN